jgi:SET domain-containing protein
MKDHLEIRESKINGQGLFALRVFQAGDTVLQWDLSQSIAVEEWASLAEDERRYTHPLNTQRILIVQAPERFVNHSCQPNTRLDNFRDVAIGRIETGQEITSDYGSEGVAVSFQCSCGSAACRGFIK